MPPVPRGTPPPPTAVAAPRGTGWSAPLLAASKGVAAAAASACSGGRRQTPAQGRARTYQPGGRPPALLLALEGTTGGGEGRRPTSSTVPAPTPGTLPSRGTLPRSPGHPVAPRLRAPPSHAANRQLHDYRGGRNGAQRTPTEHPRPPPPKITAVPQRPCRAGAAEGHPCRPASAPTVGAQTGSRATSSPATPVALVTATPSLTTPPPPTTSPPLPPPSPLPP